MCLPVSMPSDRNLVVPHPLVPPRDAQDVRRTTELLRMLVVNPSTVPQGRLV